MKKTILFLATIASSLSSFALNPSPDYAVLPSDYGMDYKEVRFAATDGLNLNGWQFKPMVTSTKYIIISDDGNGNMADNIEIAAQFLSAGYNVLMYDYRGYGKSDSFKINPKFYIYPQFEKDIQGALDYLRKFASPGNCDLYGIGIGAGLSLGVGSNSPQVRRIIADGPYVSFEEMKTQLKTKRNQDVLMPLAYDKVFMEPLYALQTGSTQDRLYGVLLIVGANDDLVGPNEIKELQRVHPKNIGVYVVPNSTNDKNFETNKNEYFNQIKKFTDAH